jgi:hypothetical protein
MKFRRKHDTKGGAEVAVSGNGDTTSKRQSTGSSSKRIINIVESNHNNTDKPLRVAIGMRKKNDHSRGRERAESPARSTRKPKAIAAVSAAAPVSNPSGVGVAFHQRAKSPSPRRSRSRNRTSTSKEQHKDKDDTHVQQVHTTGKGKTKEKRMGDNIASSSTTANPQQQSTTNTSNSTSDIQKMLLRVRTLALQADRLCDDKHKSNDQPHVAILKHVELQALIASLLVPASQSACSIKKSSHEEAMLRFALADSVVRVALIHEVKFHDLQESVDLYKQTLVHYRDLRVHLAVAKLCDDAANILSKSKQRQSIHNNKALTYELSLNVCVVLIRLSENYMKQRNWVLAQQACNEALDTIGGAERESVAAANNTNATQSQSLPRPKKMRNLRTRILDNLEVIHKSKLTAFPDASHTSVDHKGAINNNTQQDCGDDYISLFLASHAETFQHANTYDCTPSSYAHTSISSSNKMTWFERVAANMLCDGDGDYDEDAKMIRNHRG